MASAKDNLENLEDQVQIVVNEDLKTLDEYVSNVFYQRNDLINNAQVDIDAAYLKIRNELTVLLELGDPTTREMSPCLLGQAEKVGGLPNSTTNSLASCRTTSNAAVTQIQNAAISEVIKIKDDSIAQINSTLYSCKDIACVESVMTKIDEAVDNLPKAIHYETNNAKYQLEMLKFDDKVCISGEIALLNIQGNTILAQIANCAKNVYKNL